MDKFEQLAVTIIESALLETNEKWNFRNVTSPFNRLYFIFEGEGCIENSNSVTMLKPGCCYLIPLNTTNNYTCSKRLLKYYCHFQMKIYNYIDIFKLQKDVFQMPFNQKHLAELLENATKNPLIGNFALKTYLHQIAAAYGSRIIDEAHCGIENALKYQHVFSYIKSKCSIKMSTKEISDALNMPLLKLKKDFKKDMGLPLNDYLDTVVIEAAKEQLLCTNLYIKEIAFKFGFCDEFYFSRFFKKRVGLSPKYYREYNKIN